MKANKTLTFLAKVFDCEYEHFFNGEDCIGLSRALQALFEFVENRHTSEKLVSTLRNNDALRTFWNKQQLLRILLSVNAEFDAANGFVERAYEVLSTMEDEEIIELINELRNKEYIYVD